MCVIWDQLGSDCWWLLEVGGCYEHEIVRKEIYGAVPKTCLWLFWSVAGYHSPQPNRRHLLVSKQSQTIHQAVVKLWQVWKCDPNWKWRTLAFKLKVALLEMCWLQRLFKYHHGSERSKVLISKIKLILVPTKTSLQPISHGNSQQPPSTTHQVVGAYKSRWFDAAKSPNGVHACVTETEA